MATNIDLTLPPGIQVVNMDVEFTVRDGRKLVGVLKISRGGLDWKPANARSAISATWREFGDWMKGDD